LPINVHQGGHARTGAIKPTAYAGIIQALQIVEFVQTESKYAAEQGFVGGSNKLRKSLFLPGDTACGVEELYPPPGGPPCSL
jgi:hypothetical protein